MSLDVGTLHGSVYLNTTPAERALQRLTRLMYAVGDEAKAASVGFGAMDDGLIAASRAADKASASLGRTTATTRTAATADERAAAMAKAHADAVARVTAVTNGSAAAGQRVVQSQLRLIASQERYDTVMASGAATTQRLAAAQAGLIGSERSLAAASLAADRSVIASSKAAAAARKAQADSMVATGKKMSHALTLPILAVAAVAVDQAAKYQKSMTLIQTAGGETAAKANAISGGIMKIAVSTGTSLDQLSHGIYTIAKAGATKWSAAGQLEVLKAAAQGAKAEAVPLGTAVDALSTIMFDYGAKTSDAVKYENMLIRGSGLAKTSMQEYAASLSNVVPIAAAVGLSFTQVGGAIATMTQHGVSAQQATENLRNLITNLAGGNNVAVSAMQQLGINTVDLSKNLGRRGLTGTLGIVDKALKDHTHNGLIVTDVHKAAALATRSLSTEMGTFTGKLKDQSAGLLSGHVNIKEYTKYAKSLGGQAGAGALQFLALYKSSQGFSDQLKSGRGTITTTVAALNKMLGGITGSSVALQISGKYAKQNAENVAAMAKAYRLSGADVLGWGKTQGTLAVKIDKAKAALQVMAVEIGTALIPAVSKVVGWVSQAVHWFSSLSGTQKQVLGWSLGILAALGPVLAIGGRLAMVGRGIGGFAVGLGNVFTRITTGATGMSLGVTRAVTGLTSALAGAGIGLAVGSLTKGASTTTKVLGALGSTAAGAAIGFGAGGPLGAAIGGIAGGLTALATSYHSSGDSAKNASRVAAAALAAQKQAADDLLGSLEAVNGAYDKRFRQSVIKKLGDSGALGIANKAGVNLPSMIDNVIGKGGPAQIAKMRAQIENAFAAGKINPKEYAQLDKAFQNLGLAAGTAETRLQLEAKAAQQGLLSNAQLGVGIHKLRAAFANTGHTIDDNSAASQRNRAIILQNLDSVNANAVAQLKHGKSVQSVASAYEGQISTLDTNLHKLGFNQREVQKLIGTYAKMPKSVLTELVKRGVLPADIQAIIDKYNHVPKDKKTNVYGNTKPASNNLDALSRKLRGVVDGTYLATINVTANISPSAIRAENLLNNVRGSAAFRITNKSSQPGFAAGGKIPANTRFTVGEEGWEGGETDSQGRATIYSHPQAKAMGFKAPTAYASGTGSYAAIAALLSGLGATRAGIAGWLGNTSAESGGRTSAVGGPAHGLQQWQGGRFGELQAIARRMGVSWSSQAAQLAMIRHELTGGYRGTLNNLRHATSASAAANYVNRHYEISADGSGNRARLAERFYRSGVSAATGGNYAAGGIQYASAMAAQNAQVRKQQQLAKAVDTAGVNLAKVAGDSKATAANVRAATAKLTQSARALHASASTLRQAVGYQRAINIDAARRTTLMGRLAGAQSAYKAGVAQRSADYSSFVAPTRDAFNISDASQYAAATTTRRQAGATISTTTPGGISLASILASDKAAAGTARRFGADLSALARRGLNKTDVAALAAAGPSADPVARALLGASRSQIAALNANRTSINSSAGKMASSLAHKFDDAGINAATGLAHGLTSQIGHLDHVMVRLADHMTWTLKRRLRIHSPSQVFHDLGTMLPKGLANGIHEKLPEVRRAAGHMADATNPGLGGGFGGGGFAVHHQTVIHPAPGMSEREIGRAAASDAVWQLQMIGGLPT